jgi:Peptidylarginine deiminase and related enzymes
VPDAAPASRATPVTLATPAAAGFAMTPEWAPHAGCLMAWPSRLALWGDRFAEARRDYATVARAIADFEPVLAFLASVYPGREVVAVPGATLAFGGGGPHCSTQQIPIAG